MNGIIILGAGPCGLGVAYRLNELGHAGWMLYERNAHAGGLSASFTDDKGFTWDIGGHVLFSHYEYFDKAIQEVLGSAYYEHLRESWIRILETWVPYPFQNNIRYLPPDAMEECIDGLRNLRGNPLEAATFRDWMDAVFGSGIVKYFMEPYNRKVWQIPLDLMSKNWIGERVSVIDLTRIEKNIAEGRDDVSWGPNNKFKFPKKGGTGAVFERISLPFRNHINFKHEMTRVDIESKQVTFADGKTVAYDVLINTTPLDEFIGKCVRVPEAVRDAADTLLHNSALIVGLGLRRKKADSKCWMYFPESNSPFYRVTNFHNYSPFNVPENDTNKYSSLMCETSYSSFKTVHRDQIVESTIQGLINSGMIAEQDRECIISRYLLDVPHSYPIPTLARDKALAIIQSYLEANNVFSRGRFGAWKYEVGNMDHSFMQGVEAVDRILNEKPEITVNS